MVVDDDPAVHLHPRAGEPLDVGHVPDRRDDEVGLQAGAVDQFHPGGGGGAEQPDAAVGDDDADARLRGHGPHVPAHDGAEQPVQRGSQVDDGDVLAQRAGGRGDLHAEEPAAHDEHRGRRGQVVAQAGAVAVGAQHPFVLAGVAQAAGAAAGGDDQAVVGHGPGGGVHGPRTEVQPRRRRLQAQVDVVGQWREDDVVDRLGAGEHALRQRHPGVGRHVLVAEHGDPAVEVLHPQHLHRGERRDGAADDDDLAQAHGSTLSCSTRSAATGHTRAPASALRSSSGGTTSCDGGPRRRRRRGRRPPAPCRRTVRGPRTGPGPRRSSCGHHLEDGELRRCSG